MPAAPFRNVTLLNEISTHLQECADTVSLVNTQSFINNTLSLSLSISSCLCCVSVSALFWASAVRGTLQSLLSWSWEYQPEIASPAQMPLQSVSACGRCTQLLAAGIELLHWRWSCNCCGTVGGWQLLRGWLVRSWVVNSNIQVLIQP